MTTIKSFFVLAIMMIASVFISKSAQASLNNSVSLPGFSTGYNTYVQDDGTVNFNAHLSNIDRITNASISISRDTGSEFGWVSVYFNGDMLAPVAKDYENNSLSINRHNVILYSNVGLGTQSEFLGWDEKNQVPIYGALLSSANANTSLSGVTPLYAYDNYSEYTSTNDPGKGLTPSTSTTYWNDYVQWRIRFDDTSVIGKGLSEGVSVGSPSNVPEPASLGVLSIGIAAFIACRRQSR